MLSKATELASWLPVCSTLNLSSPFSSSSDKKAREGGGDLERWWNLSASTVDTEMKHFPVRFYGTCSSQELCIFKHQLLVHYDTRNTQVPGSCPNLKMCQLPRIAWVTSPTHDDSLHTAVRVMSGATLKQPCQHYSYLPTAKNRSDFVMGGQPQ